MSESTVNEAPGDGTDGLSNSRSCLEPCAVSGTPRNHLLDGLPSGSYLAINDSIDTSQSLEEALRVYEASGAVPYRTRSLEQFTGYFDGLELVAPGVVVPVDDWRPDPGVARGPVIPQAGAVGRKK